MTIKINQSKLDPKSYLDVLPVALFESLDEKDITIFVAAVRGFPEIESFIIEMLSKLKEPRVVPHHTHEDLL